MPPVSCWCTSSILHGQNVNLGWNLQRIFRHFQSQYRHLSFLPLHWRSISWWHRLWGTAAWLQRRKPYLALLLYTSIIRFSVVCFWWVFHRRPNTPSTYSFTDTLLFSSPSWYTLFCITPWKRKWNFQLTIQLFTKLWRLTWKNVHWERGWEIKQFENMVMTTGEILWNKERSLLNSESPTLTMNNILPTWIAYKLTFNLP